MNEKNNDDFAAEAQPEEPVLDKDTFKAAENESAEDDAYDDEDEEAEKKNKKAAVIVLLTFIVIVIAAAVVWQLYEHYVFVGSVFGSHKVYSRSVSEVDLSGSDIKDFSGLGRLEEVKTIDLTNTSIDDLSIFSECYSLKTLILNDRTMTAEKCIEFNDMMPGVNLKCKIMMGGKVYDSQITELKADGLIEDELSLLSALQQLKSLDLTGSNVSDAKYNYLSEKLSNCEIKRNIHIFDSVFESTATEIDLRGYKYSLDEFKAVFDANLQYLPNLKKVDMSGCGLSNDEMEELNNTYEGIQFVWIISVSNGRWNVRSDATAFSCLIALKDEENIYDEKDFEPIYKYCTDLVALDVGHNANHDISQMSNLTKLRAIIITDNLIRDISCFENMKDLEFIEANASNRIQSFEPLRNLKKLKYLNFYSNKDATDLSPLYNHEELELCIFHLSVKRNERTAFKESNPNCTTYYYINTLDDFDPITTNEEWRANSYRRKLKKVFTNWKYVVGYDEETGEYIFDWDTDQYDVITRKSS